MCCVCRESLCQGWELCSGEDDPYRLAVVADAGDPEASGEYALNYVTTRSYGPEGNVALQKFVSASGEIISGQTVVQKHTLGEFQLIANKPGTPGVRIQGACFEFMAPAGRLMFDFSDLTERLHIEYKNKGNVWFARKLKQWQNKATSFGLPENSVRASMPFAMDRSEGSAATLDRCLLWPAVSTRWLFVFRLPSCKAMTEKHGLLVKSDTKAAMERVYLGLIDNLPPSFDINVCLELGAVLEGKGGCAHRV